MQQWEYQLIPLWTSSAKNLMEVMNMLGEDGWEFVGEIHNDNDEYAVLKRPKQVDL